MLVVLLSITAVAISASVPGTNGEDVSLQELLQRIQLMESTHSKAIELMVSRHTEDIQRLSMKHEEDIRRLTSRVENCERTTVSVLDKLSSTEEVKDEAFDSSEETAKKREHKLSTYQRRNTGQDNTIRTPSKRLYEGNNIAFSAYLDHDLNGVGTDQVIVLNQVLLNDGNGYSPITGTFTAPLDGVYSFNFFIGDRDRNQMFARLTVNNIPKVDGIVQTNHGGEDAQGGNAANLKLSAGDIVMLKHTREYFHDTDHMEGSDVARLSTFSGFLIYPVEQPVQIVGK